MGVARSPAGVGRRPVRAGSAPRRGRRSEVTRVRSRAPAALVGRAGQPPIVIERLGGLTAGGRSPRGPSVVQLTSPGRSGSRPPPRGSARHLRATGASGRRGAPQASLAAALPKAVLHLTHPTGHGLYPGVGQIRLQGFPDALHRVVGAGARTGDEPDPVFPEPAGDGQGWMVVKGDGDGRWGRRPPPALGGQGSRRGWPGR